MQLKEILSYIKSKLGRQKLATLSLFFLLAVSNLSLIGVLCWRVSAMLAVAVFLAGMALCGSLARRLGYFKKVDLISAAIYLDQAVQTKDQAAALVELRKGDLDVGFGRQDARIDLIDSQLSERLRDILPTSIRFAGLPRRLKQLACSLPLTWGCLLWLLMGGGAYAPVSEQSKNLMALASEEFVPPKLSEDLKELAKILDQQGSSKDEIKEALKRAEDDLNEAMSVSESQEGVSKIVEPNKISREKGKAFTPTPTPEPERKESDKQKEKSAGAEKSGASQADSEQKKDSDSKDGKDGKEGDSGSKAGKDGKQEQKSADGNDGEGQKGQGSGEGSSDKQGEGQSSGTQQQEGGAQGEQQKGEKGQSQSDKQGEKGQSEGAQKDGEQADGKEGEDGKEGKEGQAGNTGQESKAGAKGEAQGKDGKGQEAKGEAGLDQVKKSLDEVKQSLDKPGNDQQANSGEKGEQGSAGDKKKESSQEKKQDQNQQSKGEQAGQTKPSEKKEQEAKSSENHGAENAKESAEEGSDNNQDAKKSSLPKAGEKRSDEGQLGEEGPGIKGEKGFQNAEVNPDQEKYSTEFAGKDSELVKNRGDAKPKTELSDVLLARPESTHSKESQKIPLEYRDVIK